MHRPCRRLKVRRAVDRTQNLEADLREIAQLRDRVDFHLVGASQASGRASGGGRWRGRLTSGEARGRECRACTPSTRCATWR